MAQAHFPATVSLYEALRSHPEASGTLGQLGLGREHYEYRLGDAARLAGVPVARLTEAFPTP